MVQGDILNILGFTKGELPIRYLGVPLNSKRLPVMQYYPLVDKMSGRIISRTSKFLSYSGRLQLIKTVLFSIQVYWSQIFVLPTRTNFLWGGGVEMKRKAPLAWDRVCWPRTAGGFNVLHIETWNKAAVCKLLWNLHTKKDKLWVRWVHIYYGKGRQLWEVEPQQASWILTKILKAKKYLQETGMRMTEMSQLKTSTKKMYQKMRGEFVKVL